MVKRMILITIDCWRKDKLETFGSDYRIMPHINKLCRNSFIFRNFISNSSNTAPSFFALFTSKIPVIDGRYTPITDEQEQFSEILRNNGIITCAIHSNPHLGRICNYHKGFNYFYDLLEKPPSYFWKKKAITLFHSLLKFFKTSRKLIKGIKLVLKVLNIKRFEILNKSDLIKKPYINAEITTKKAIEWLQNIMIKISFYGFIIWMDIDHIILLMSLFPKYMIVLFQTQKNV